MSETKTRARHSYRPDDRLTRAETAAYLGISKSRLSQLRREGKIKHEKNTTTRAVRYRFADVEKLRVERATTVIGL